MAVRVFSDGHLLLETVEDSLLRSQDFAGLLKQRICEVKGVPSHRQKLLLPGKSELTEGCSWKSLGNPLEVSMEIQPDDHAEELVYACEHKREKDVQRLLREGRNPNAKGKGQQRPLDVAIRSRHLGIVRALLEGKAHLTPDALHLTADHQSAEMHHSVLRVLIAARAPLDSLRKGDSPFDGMTALQQACIHGSTEVVQLLLSARANIKAQSTGGETALHLATNYDIAMALFNAKADAGILDKSGAKALYRAAENGLDSVTRAFFDAGVIPKEDWESTNKLMRIVHAQPPCSCEDKKLRFAVWEVGHAIDEYIAEGANPNQANIFGFTPLHLAAWRNNLEGVRGLLRCKAHPDPTASDEEAVTPMHLAAENSGVDVVLHLVEASADINRKCGMNQQSALHAASLLGDVDMVRGLILSSAALDECDADGETPLHLAAFAGQSKTAQLLLVANASVGQHDGSGNTPFHLAASNGHMGVVKSFLMAFAPLDQQDHSDGNLTLHLAARAGHLEVVRSLVEAMASVHAQNKSGNSPLHLASAYARVEVMHFLLQARAHVNCPNFRGETPFNLALQDGLNEVAQILREAGGTCAEYAYGDPSYMWPKNFQVFAWPTMPMPISMPAMPMPMMPMPE